MSNRWHMHRMGFINFWLYDEETFLFADGRLLLRGQNGSGKSVTTQSLIPFILDGDRSPGVWTLLAQIRERWSTIF